MNPLPTFIEYLLLSHDYVVVPGLGTFIVQQSAARRNDDEETFLPPVRSLRFNAELNHADNLISDTISTLYNISKEQASQTLTLWVSELLQELDDEHEVEFGTIGLFTRELDGTPAFISQESGIASPDAYGLDAFHISQVHAEPRAKVVPMAATMETSDKEITIRINRRIANVFVAACAAVLLFIVFNSPVANTTGIEQRSSVRELLMGHLGQDAKEEPTAQSQTEAPQRRTAYVVKHVIVHRVLPSQPGAMPETEPVEEAKMPTPVAEEAESPKAIAPAAKAPGKAEKPAPVAEVPAKAETVAPVATEVATQTGQYCIVMASAVTKRNAEEYAVRLREQGFNNPRVMASDKMVRVVVGNYATESEAYNVAETIRRSSEEYASVWVLKF